MSPTTSSTSINQCPTIPEGQEKHEEQERQGECEFYNELHRLYEKLASIMKLTKKLDEAISATDNTRHNVVLQNIKKMEGKRKETTQLKLDVQSLKIQIEKLEEKESVSEAEVEHLQRVWEDLHHTSFKRELYNQS